MSELRAVPEKFESFELTRDISAAMLSTQASNASEIRMARHLLHAAHVRGCLSVAAGT
jgi:hypothetical protein